MNWNPWTSAQWLARQIWPSSEKTPSPSNNTGGSNEMKPGELPVSKPQEASNMTLSKQQVLNVQRALNSLSFTGKDGWRLKEDGIFGDNTSFAVINYKKSVGLVARDYVGPITYAKLTGDDLPIRNSIPQHVNDMDPPWVTEMLRWLGRHEREEEVKLWLKSDGTTVGDPARIPWCGDGVETSFKNTVPGIVVPENPYLALNWKDWGKYVEPQRGAVMSFWRGSPSNWQGHVAFYMGESQHNYYCLGANQTNRVTIAPIAKNRLREGGSRWPVHPGVPEPTGLKIAMTGGVVSTNEA